MIKRSVNAGVDAQTGFALQRNTALYLLLEDYEDKFKDKDYFICLEHHDDFIFCFLNDNQEAEVIEAYQSKKKSPSEWKLNNELIEIVKKLLATGQHLLKDLYPKSDQYKHFLYFSTNQTINLNVRGRGEIVASESIKEDNTNVSYLALHSEIQHKILEKIEDVDLHNELYKLNFKWIDLNRTVEKQEYELVGQIDKVFGAKINNPRAAIKTLLSLFRNIEERYNQGSIVKLLDESKRVTSGQIEDAFNILTSKSKCFDHWRAEKRNVAQVLKIKPFEQEVFELNFDSAFDLFKSITEAEHRKILEFVKDNYKDCESVTEEDAVIELMELFNKTQTTSFEPQKLKAILFAAYFEATFKQK
jgi:hypothetical protein